MAAHAVEYGARFAVRVVILFIYFQIRRVPLEELRQRIHCDFLLLIFTVSKVYKSVFLCLGAYLQQRH